jgi:crotonobetainyl-CoA:carnitine CoA-transferase CaiB-like acyl-CoA transferase
MKPLEGIRVIELGQLLAGPFCGTMLAYFGAEVIKVEPPKGGDPIRGWRLLDDTGTAYWWRSLGRNKKCCTLDLKQDKGRELAKELIKSADVVIENFRPGTMEEWGMSYEELKAINPQIIFTRISGYGQTGPYSSKPGFASVCEGISGFRFVNGFPDEAPVRPNLSIGDTMAGIHAFMGILMALLNKTRNPSEDSGQVVDVAIYESIFNLLEGVIPEYSGAGEIRQASGTTITGIVPTNTYRTKDAKFVVIGGNGDSIFKRLMIAVGREDLAKDPELADNAGRVKREQELDEVLAAWCSAHTREEVLKIMADVRVPAGPIYNAADMVADEHFQARELFESIEINGKPMSIPAIMPKLSKTPGSTEWPGGEVASHNHEVFSDILGLSEEEINALKTSEVI